MYYALRIEVDGHLNGSPLPRSARPWVARLWWGGRGLRREFIRPLRDWSRARRSWRGNVYGVVETYMLTDGVYEVAQLSGKRRAMERQCIEVICGMREDVPADDLFERVLAWSGDVVR